MRSPFQRQENSDGSKGPAEPVGRLPERCVLSGEGLRGECTRNLRAEQPLPHDVEVGGVKERPQEGAPTVDPPLTPDGLPRRLDQLLGDDFRVAHSEAVPIDYWDKMKVAPMFDVSRRKPPDALFAVASKR